MMTFRMIMNTKELSTMVTDHKLFFSNRFLKFKLSFQRLTLLIFYYLTVLSYSKPKNILYAVRFKQNEKHDYFSN